MERRRRGGSEGRLGVKGDTGEDEMLCGEGRLGVVEEEEMQGEGRKS